MANYCSTSYLTTFTTINYAVVFLNTVTINMQFFSTRRISIYFLWLCSKVQMILYVFDITIFATFTIQVECKYLVDSNKKHWKWFDKLLQSEQSVVPLFSIKLYLTYLTFKVSLFNVNFTLSPRCQTCLLLTPKKQLQNTDTCILFDNSYL